MQVQYTYELHAARFSFWVAPGAWLVHVHLDRRKHKAQQKAQEEAQERSRL